MTTPLASVVSREKRWPLEFLIHLVRDAGLARPERLASQMLLLIDGVSGRALVEGPEAAAHAVDDARLVAELLVAAADGPT